MKKRLQTAAVVAVSAILGLGGCGGGNQPGAENPGTSGTTPAEAATEVTTGTQQLNSGDSGGLLRVTWWGNQVRNEVTNQVLSMYQEEHPEVSFESEFTDFANYWSKLATLAASNSLQDVMQMNHIYLPDYARNGLLLDLTPYVEDGTLNLDQVSANMTGSGMVDGKIYAVSLGANAPALVYNADVAAAAGVEIRDNMSIAEFIEISRTIYEKTGVQTNIAYGYMENFAEYYVRDQGYVLFEENKLGVPDPSVFEDLFRFYADALAEGWQIDASHFVELSPGTIETDPLISGKSWAFFCFSNQLGAIRSAAPDVNFGITTWPADHPEKANYVKPALFFSVAANTGSPQAAVGLVDYVTNSVPANEVLLAERGVPVSGAVSEAIKPLLGEAKQAEFDYVELVNQTSSPMNPPAKGRSSEVNILMNGLVEKLLYGQLTPEEAAAQLYQQGNEIMAQ